MGENKSQKNGGGEKKNTGEKNGGGEKKNTGEKNGGGEKKNTGEIVKKKDPVGGNKKDGNLTAVSKSDFHYDGCVTKDVKAIRIVGDSVEVYSEKLTVSGKVDPVIVRQIVQQETHKHVQFISPVPKNDGKGKGDAGAGEGKTKQNNEKDSKENKEDKKTKEKEPPITTAVLTVPLHCQGCTKKIHKIVTEFKEEMKIDKENDLATVTGSMNNMNDLAAKLKKDLKKEAEIVPLKKEGGDKKEKAKGKGGEGNGEGKGKVKA